MFTNLAARQCAMDGTNDVKSKQNGHFALTPPLPGCSFIN